MSTELNLVMSLLKLTNKETPLIETVNMDAKTSSSVSYKLLMKFQNEGLVHLSSYSVEVKKYSRLRLAYKAITLGGDIERISQLLCWQEFEEIAALALRKNGYEVQKNLRFKKISKRWEIDVVGFKKPLVICIDCKHWKNAIASSTLNKITDLQKQRTKALADSLPNINLKLECTKWEKAKFIPAVLSLIQCESKFYNNIPVVPVLQVQDFIHQLPGYIEKLTVYSKKFKILSNVLSN